MRTPLDQAFPTRGPRGPGGSLITAVHCPNQTPAEVEEAIVVMRRDKRRGQDWIGLELGVAARTVCRVLRRQAVPYLREVVR